MPAKKKDDPVAAAAKEDFEFTYRQVLNMVGAAGAGNRAGAAYNYDDLHPKNQQGTATTMYGSFRIENSNIFRKYNQLSLISPHVFIPLAKLGLIVVSGLRLESKNKQALEIMEKWSKNINLLEKVENIARSTVKEGTCVVELVKEKPKSKKVIPAKAKTVKGTGTEIKGITGLDILPMRYVTLLPEGYTVGTVKNTLIKGDVEKILLYEKQNNLETQATLERDEVALFRIFHEGNFFKDILGRETYSIYGVSLLEAIDLPLKNLLDMMEGYATHMRRYGVGRLHINIPLVEELRKQGRYAEAKQILEDTITSQQRISQNEDIISGGAEVRPLSTGAGGGIESMKAALEADIHIGLLQAPLSMGDTKGSTYAAGRMSEEDRYIVLESVQHIFISTVQKEIIDPQLVMLGYEEGEVEVVIDKLDQPYPDYKTVTDALMNGAITVEEYRAKLGFPEEKPKSKLEEAMKKEAEMQKAEQLAAQKKLIESQLPGAGQPAVTKEQSPSVDQKSSPDANKSSPDVTKTGASRTKIKTKKKIDPDIAAYYRTKLSELQHKKETKELSQEQFDDQVIELRKSLVDKELHPEFDGIILSGAGSNMEDAQRKWYFANFNEGNIDKEGNITEKGTKAGVKPWVTNNANANNAISENGNFPKGIKEMYASNSRKGAFTFKQFVETEIEERGNYPNLDIDKLKQKYNLTDESKVIWVTSEKWIANRYNMESDSNDYENAKDVPEDEMSIYPYTPDQGFIIPETDDGDKGFLYVFTNKKSASSEAPVSEATTVPLTTTEAHDLARKHAISHMKSAPAEGAGIGWVKVGRTALGQFREGLDLNNVPASPDQPTPVDIPKTKEQREIDRKLRVKFHNGIAALNQNIKDGAISQDKYEQYFENLKRNIEAERIWRYQELLYPLYPSDGCGCEAEPVIDPEAEQQK